MNRKRKLLFSFFVAILLWAALWFYATLPDSHLILPIRLLVAPAFIIGALVSGNVHQPSVIGAWLVLLTYLWLVTYAIMAFVGSWLGKRKRLTAFIEKEQP